MDKSLLFTRRLDTAQVDIPGVGEVTVRALTRQEMLDAGSSMEGKSTLEAERTMLALGMVDPQLTEAEVAQWQAASPASEIDAVVKKINELSGIGKGVAKAAYKSDGDGPVAGV